MFDAVKRRLKQSKYFNSAPISLVRIYFTTASFFFKLKQAFGSKLPVVLQNRFSHEVPSQTCFN